MEISANWAIQQTNKAVQEFEELETAELQGEQISPKDWEAVQMKLEVCIQRLNFETRNIKSVEKEFGKAAEEAAQRRLLRRRLR